MSIINPIIAQLSHNLKTPLKTTASLHLIAGVVMALTAIYLGMAKKSATT